MPNTERLIYRAAGWVVARARLILIAFALAAVLLGWQSRQFRIDASPDTLLTRDNEHFIRTMAVARRFSPQEFLLIGYEPKTRALFSEETFDDLRWITGRLRKMQRVEAVHSILSVPLFSLAEGGLNPQTDPGEWTIEKRDFSMEQLVKAFRGHPIYEDLLVNKAQTATAIQVVFKADEAIVPLYDRMAEIQEALLERPLTHAEEEELERLKRAAEPIERRLDRERAREIGEIRGMFDRLEDHARMYLGGVHVLALELIGIIRTDLVIFGGAIAALVCAILFLLFRRLRWVAIPVLCCALSVLYTLGLFGMLGLKTTVISSNFIALQIILTLGIVIHLVVQYREYGRAHPDWSGDRLIRETLARKAVPCFFAGATTSVGFGSLVFSGIQPVIDFGWMMIIAMSFSLIVSLALFPALLAPMRALPVMPRRAVTDSVVGFFSRLALRRGALIGGGAGLLLALSIAGALRLDVENSFLNYFRETTEVRRELAFVDRHFGGSTPMELVYTVPYGERTEDLALKAETAGTLQLIQAELERHEAVGKILSIVNFTELARKLNDGKPLTEYELAAIYWSFEEALREKLLGSYFSKELWQARFSARIRDGTPGLDRGALIASLHEGLRRLGVPRDRYTLTGLFIVYEDVLQQLFRSQAHTLAIVYGVLALTFLLLFRSFTLALIAMAPNILSTAGVLGLMGWLGIPLDIMTITIAAIAMGIAVDDTIHYIHRYREELAEAEPGEAVRRSFEGVGHAMIYTSLVISAGFSVLAFSNFMPSVLFGLLTAAAMVIALSFNLTVLPALLRRYYRRAA